MVVVIIVAISAAAVGPGIAASMAIGRTQRYQADLLRILGRARSEAIGSGRAMTLVTTPDGAGSALNLYRGDSSSCSRSAWAVIIGADRPLDSVSTLPYSTSGFTTRVTLGPTTPAHICFEPDGDRFGRNSAVVPFARVSESYLFVVERLNSTGTSVDPIRQVIVPAFAAPRVLR